MEEPTIRYQKGDLVVLWKPKTCTHSGKCVRGLPDVFDVNRKPWIDVNGATEQAIMDQIDRCPSGALSYIRPGEKD